MLLMLAMGCANVPELVDFNSKQYEITLYNWMCL